MAVTSATSANSFPMTGGRRAALVIGTPVCLLLVAGTGLSLVADVGQGHYPVHYTVPASTRALTVNVTGQLTIRPTTAAQATLTGKATYSLARSKVTESTTSAATTIGYDCPVSLGTCELDATVAVPATVTTLTASSGGGDATVTGTTGPVKLSTGDGNLSVSQASGPLALNTDSGSISGSGIATDTITASSGDGDIQITFTRVPGNVRVNTNSGNITLVLPPSETKYHVTANTDSGTVADTLPRDQSAPNTITASSGSGNITISQ